MSGSARLRRGIGAVICAAVLCWGSTATAQEAAAPSPDPDPWFGTDKALHFGAGVGIGIGGYALGAGVIDNRWAGVGLSLGLTAAIGGIKEGIDAAGAGQPSWKDFAWDMLGGMLGMGSSCASATYILSPQIA